MNQVNNDIYETYGDRWYTAYDDPIALLRAESKAKVPWVLERIKTSFKLEEVELLDVGCGGGFLTNALARENFKAIHGVDLSPESVRVAKEHDQTGKVQYQAADAFHLPYPDQSFDVLTAMDFLEHIEDPKAVIQEFSRVLRPGGIFIYHTFNRNMIAWLIIIKFVEWLVKNTPKDMHVLRLFIKPKELREYCEMAQMTVEKEVGLRPMLSTITLRSLFTGIVPKGLRFTTTASLLLSFMGQAKKKS